MRTIADTLRVTTRVSAMSIATRSLIVALSFAAELSAQESAELDAAAAEERGFDYFLGRGVPADAAEAARWFELGAAAGRPLSVLYLGMQYRDGIGVPNDPERAFALLRQAAEQGWPQAQGWVGYAYLGGKNIGAPVERDFDEALRWLSAAAAQGDAYALYVVGSLYRRGEGVAQDPDLGFRLTMRAAELGNGRASNEIAAYLMYGPPERRDSPKAVRLLTRLAGSNAEESGLAAVVLGFEYLLGAHVERDTGLAIQWLASAAERKQVQGLLWLSHVYEHGVGTEIDRARAATLRDEGLAAASSQEKNGFAWQLAVTPDPLLRDGAQAVAIMEALTADPAERRPAFLDTLAAAYAEAGRFEDAERAQAEAIAAIPPGNERSVQAFDERLTLYRNHEPYREGGQ